MKRWLFSVFIALVLNAQPANADSCCFCIYQDKDPWTHLPEPLAPSFKSECEKAHGNDGNYEWLKKEHHCQKVEVFALSDIAKIKKESCGQMVVAYAGHAKAMHLDELLATCDQYAPDNCKGGLCVKSSACGVPEDYRGLSMKDSGLVNRLLNQFSLLNIESNQTECTSSYNTVVEQTAKKQNGKVVITNDYISCFPAGGGCSAEEEHYLYHGKVRHYRNYWSCNDGELGLKTQYCCGTDARGRKWNPPGEACK